MSRLEVSGYLQIVIGLVGIVLTLLTAPAVLDAANAVTAGKELPPELSGVSGAVRIFAVLFILTVLTAMVSIGSAVVASVVAKKLGAYHPLLACFMLVVAILATSIGMTLALLGTPFWAPAIWWALSSLILSAAACLTERLDDIGALAAVFGGLFVIVSLGAMVVASST